MLKGQLGLALNAGKSLNLAVAPGNLIGSVVRRGGSLSQTAKRPSPERESQLQRLNKDEEEPATRQEGVFPGPLTGGLPYSLVDQLEILGVTFVAQLGFAQHIVKVLQRANFRHAVMARLSRCTWGLEAGILRPTNAVLSTSLSTYGLAVVGSGAYGKSFRQLGTAGGHISARRITGISRSARLEALHMTAGGWSEQNQYAWHFFWREALFATRCSLMGRFSAWLRTVYSAPGGFAPDIRVWELSVLRVRTVVSGIWERGLREKWPHSP